VVGALAAVVSAVAAVLALVLGLADLGTVPAHSDALVFPALIADTTVHVGRVGAVLKVIPTSCGEGCIQLLGPLSVGLGQSPQPGWR
jgi:hypothetical protein